MDFSDIDAVFVYLQKKYGENNVARVGAFSRFTCKSALRKVMSAYGYTMNQIGHVVKMLPDKLYFTLDDALKHSNELEEYFKDAQHILKIVRRIEGVLEHFSTHAGGILICENLTSMLPVVTDGEDRSKVVVALDKDELEWLGHHKFDVLGLSSLTLLQNVLKYTPEIDWNKVDINDENIYTALSSGDVMGVFQLSEQIDKVMQQRPKCFKDLVAINALIRPGVCDWKEYLNNRESGVVSELDYMNDTHDLIVYQDQYLLLAQTYAGWDIAFSDKHIRKNKNIMADNELRQKFLEDGESNGYDREILSKVWGDICDVVSNGYGFNMAHATSYAMLSFKTAYLKYYYPKEFYAGWLTQNNGDVDKVTKTLCELKRIGVKLLPPDINLSMDIFIPTEDGILMPITAVKGVGASAYKDILRIRPITSLSDLLERRERRATKQNTVENLVKAGAFNELKINKYELLKTIMPEVIEMKDYEYEKDAMGFYLTSTPFEKYSITPLEKYDEGATVSTIVEINSLAVRYDKKGKEMAFAFGTNDIDTIRLIFFSSKWPKCKCTDGQILLVRGEKTKRYNTS